MQATGPGEERLLSLETVVDTHLAQAEREVLNLLVLRTAPIHGSHPILDLVRREEPDLVHRQRLEHVTPQIRIEIESRYHFN